MNIKINIPKELDKEILDAFVFLGKRSDDPTANFQAHLLGFIREVYKGYKVGAVDSQLESIRVAESKKAREAASKAMEGISIL